MDLRACPCCGLVHRLEAEGVWRCERCRHALPGPRLRYSSQLCAALACSALLIYPAAMLLPVMAVERLGHRHEAGVLDGALGLLRHGSWLIGVVVLMASVVVPLLKLVGLLLLSLVGHRLHDRLRAGSWRMLELVGRWAMLDVLLVAVLVAAIKIGDLAEVQPGSGAWAFTLLVLLNLAASMVFDPAAMWDGDRARSPAPRAEAPLA